LLREASRCKMLSSRRSMWSIFMLLIFEFYEI
jgi:hypothetical protein